MKIEYKGIYRDTDELYDATIVAIHNRCCLKMLRCLPPMTRRIDISRIGFGGQGTSTKLNIIPQDCVVACLEIDYCPFCGEKIVMTESKKVKRVKMSQPETVVKEFWIEEDMK